MVRTQKKSFNINNINNINNIKNINNKNIKKTRKKHNINNYKQLGGAPTNPTYKDIKVNCNHQDLVKYPLQGVYPNGMAYEILEPYNNHETFMVNTTKNLVNFNSIEERDILFLNLHGAINIEKYFRVPANVMVCVLNDIGDYSSIHESNLIFLDKGKTLAERQQLIDELFVYQALMSDDKQFEFKITHEIVSPFTCSNFFRNSNWYYPGQMCYDITLSAEKKKYKKESSDIYDIYEVTRQNGAKTDIKIHPKTESLKKYFGRHATNDFYTNTLSTICQKETSKKRIIILNSCQGIESIDSEKTIKKHNWYHHETNKEITKETIEKRGLKERESNYKYSCYINRYNYGTDKNRFSNDIKYLTTKPFQVNPYDKKYKIFKLVKNHFDRNDLQETHIEFLKSLNLHELQIFLEKMKIVESKHDEILKKVIDPKYIDKEALILFRIVHWFLFVGTQTTNKEFKDFLKKIMNYYNNFSSYIDPDIESSNFFKNINILLELQPEEQYYKISSITKWYSATITNKPAIIIFENVTINSQDVQSKISMFANKNEIKLFIFKKCIIPENFLLKCTEKKKIQIINCDILHNFNKYANSDIISLYIETCIFKIPNIIFNFPNYKFLTRLELLNVTGVSELIIGNVKLQRINIRDCSFSKIFIEHINPEYLEIYNKPDVLEKLDLRFKFSDLKSFKLSNYNIKENDIKYISKIEHIELESVLFDITKILNYNPTYLKCQDCKNNKGEELTRNGQIEKLLHKLKENYLYLEMIPSNEIQEYYDEINLLDEDDFGGATR